MRILMVAQGYRGYAPYYARALSALGHDVTTYVGLRQYDWSTRALRVVHVRIPNLFGADRPYEWSERQRFRAFLRRRRPTPFDLYLFVNGHTLVSDAVLAEIRALGRPSGIWLLDDYEPRDGLSLTSFDHLSTFGKSDAIRLSAETGRSWSYVPQGFAPVPVTRRRTHDRIPLVLGSPSPPRQAVAAALIDAGVPVQLVGRTWGDFHTPSPGVEVTGDVSLEESLAISSGGRININAHRRPATGVSPRVFEIAASGGLLISDNDALGDLFEPGVEALHWTDAETAVEHARRALGDRPWADGIAQRGQRRARAHHTLDRRFAALLADWGFD